MKGSLGRGIGAVAVALLLASCIGGTDAARVGVAEFRTRVAERSFEDIYRHAAPELREAASREQFLTLMTSLDGKLGAWQSASEPAWTVTRGTGGYFVNLTYQSQFAKGAATEQFAWRIENGAALLRGYHVNSSLLVSQ